MGCAKAFAGSILGSEGAEEPEELDSGPLPSPFSQGDDGGTAVGE